MNNQNDDHVLQRCKAEMEQINLLIEKFQKEMARMPEGGVSQKVINGRQYLYHVVKNGAEPKKYKQVRIKGDSPGLSEKLIRKQMLKRSLKILRRNLMAFEVFVKAYQPLFMSEISAGLTVKSSVPIVVFEEKSDRIRNWEAEEFVSCSMLPESKKHTTFDGLRVRSKSEALIAGALESRHIPFRYEARMMLEGKEFYPDFTILRPTDGETIYWEHFGMMNDEDYACSTKRKNSIYIENGLLPWNNYIVTFDSTDGSIDAFTIHNIINAHILPKKLSQT
ncbi:MAG: hypothetical protein WCL54_03930 [Clostridia bacterium]